MIGKTEEEERKEQEEEEEKKEKEEREEEEEEGKEGVGKEEDNRFSNSEYAKELKELRRVYK